MKNQSVEKTQISVIIPTLNNLSGLKYLLSYFRSKPYPLIIVDNQPDNQKKQLMRNISASKKPIYLPQKKNLGFAKAVNLGAKDVKTKWMLILNDDVEFDKVHKVTKFIKLKSKKVYKEKKTIEKLISFAEEKKLDAVSPVLVDPNGEIENCGYKLLPYGRIRLIKKLEGLKVKKIDGLTAACLLIKTSVFNSLGGFDEGFFAYLEDVEFFLRFKNQGYQLAVASDIEVIHHHMKTSKTMGSFKAKQDLINWWRLYFKHRDKFKFDLGFIVERLRNLAGMVKSLAGSMEL